MEVTDLKEIRDYWTKKYPTVDVILWGNNDNGKFFGKMMAHNSSIDLLADTVGELISQGENFLRKVTS